jgi:glycosyltransferase involved in cell wall biosynthesis
VQRYLFIDDAPIIGGSQLFGLRLAEHIRRHDPDRSLTVVCPRDTVLPERYARLGVETLASEFPDFAPRSWPAIPAAIAAARRLLARSGRDAVVLCNGPRTSAYVAAAVEMLSGGLTAVHLLHEQDTAARASARYVLDRFGAPVAVGSNAARAYERALSRVPVQRVNNFLGLEQLESFLARRSVPPADGGTPTLGLLGRWIPEKGIVELLDELAQIAGAWSRLVIGAASQDAHYEQQARERIETLGLEGRVELPGFVEDLAAFFASIDALVVPSVGHEGQPTAILEALAHGRPCVVREPLWSADFEGLPVARYRTADELGLALSGLPGEEPSAQLLKSRFGPEQVLAGIDAAAVIARGRPVVFRRPRRGGASA